MTETEGEHQILDRKEQHAHYYPQKEPERQIYPAQNFHIKLPNHHSNDDHQSDGSRQP